jgi:hypothetical protein
MLTLPPCFSARLSVGLILLSLLLVCGLPSSASTFGVRGLASPSVHVPNKPQAIPGVGLRQRSGVAPRFLHRLRFGARKHRAVRSTTTPFLAVSDFGSAAVELFDNNYNPDGSITGLTGPDGDTYDANGNLYVADYAAVNINEYAPGATTPSFTYTAGLEDPVDVATDSGGNVYVTDFAGGFVVEYAQGSNSVLHQCSLPGQGEGVVVDPSGNVFVSYNTGSAAFITEFAGGLNGCSGTVLGVTLGFAGGLKMDSAGNLIACDQISGVDIIPPPYNTVSSTITGASDSFHIALNTAENLIFIADPSTGDVLVDTYPGGSNVTTLNSANGIVDASGVAVNAAGEDPCPSPQTPSEVGQCHILVIQTLLSHFAEIKAATGLKKAPPPDQAAQVFFQAALSVPDVPQSIKADIVTLYNNFQSMQGHDPGPYCDSALSQFDTGLQSAIGSRPKAKPILSFLNSELSQFPNCSGFNFGVQSGIEIYKQGQTTIYNPGWYRGFGKLRPDARPDKKKASAVAKDAVGADIAGGAAGAVGGLLVGGIGAGPGAVAGAVTGTVASLVVDLWNWVTG